MHPQFGSMLAMALNVVFGQSISEVADLNYAMLTVFQSVLMGAFTLTQQCCQEALARAFERCTCCTAFTLLLLLLLLLLLGACREKPQRCPRLNPAAHCVVCAADMRARVRALKHVCTHTQIQTHTRARLHTQTQT